MYNRYMDITDELEQYFVTPAWAGRYYGVSKMDIHRAIESGRLKGVRVRGRWAGRGRDQIVLDMRELPLLFPRGRRGRPSVG